MRMAREIEPSLFLEADSIDDQSVTIPFADRISEPRRLAFLGQRPPIRENLPVVVVRLKEQHDQAGLLNDLPRRGVTIGIRHAVWETGFSPPFNHLRIRHIVTRYRRKPAPVLRFGALHNIPLNFTLFRL